MPEHPKPDPLDACRTLIAAFRERFADRPELLQAIRTLGAWALDELGAAPAPHSRPPESAPPAAPVLVPKPIAGPVVVRDDRPRVATTLKLGDTTVEMVEVVGTAEEARAAEAAAKARMLAARENPAIPDLYVRDLDVVIKRTRLKAESARWAVERRRRLKAGAEFLTQIGPTDAALVQQARAISDCYLWMLDPYGPTPDESLLADIAGCYDTLALAAELAKEAGDADDIDFKRAAYRLIAEAQSGLRASLLPVDVRNDRDQMDIFVWLRDHTSSERIFIDRHMRVEDPADPTQWRDLASRIEAFRESRRASADAAKQQRALINKAQYHAGRIGAALPSPAADDWAKLLTAVEQAVARGVAPDSRELLKALRPIVEHLPTDAPLSDAAARAVAAARAAAAPAAPPAATADTDEAEPAEGIERERSPEVQQVANLLRGKVVFFIGGLRRAAAQRALEEAFDLAELRWNSTRPHQSLTVFETEIARPEVAAVLLAIRWSSHSYGELQEFCARLGKPLVRLPAGYGPNRVAHEILTQISDRLETAS